MSLFRILLLALLPVAVLAREAAPAIAVPDDQKSRTDLATLVVPYAMDAEMIDGISYPGLKPFGRKGDVIVRVLPGAREVTARYRMLFDLKNGDHEVVKSKMMVLTFLAEPGKTYRMVHGDFRNVEEAKKAVENFVLRIEDEAGQNRIIGATQATTNWRGETTVNRRNDLVNAELAAAAAQAAAPVAVAPAAPVTVVPAAAPVPAATAFDTLRSTWMGASAAERALFLEWVTKNP